MMTLMVLMLLTLLPDYFLAIFFDEFGITGAVLSTLVPIKPKRLTNSEREKISLTPDLEEILVGLLLGDLNATKVYVNPLFRFYQGLVHKDYIDHLYGLFKNYCLSEPQVYSRPADPRTGKIYTSVSFNTCSLPCFNQLYNLFYVDGEKILPSNIGELLTPLGLCYWICDDGSFCKKYQVVTLNTQGFSLKEVELLIKVLGDKFGLKCTINKNKGKFIIRISRKSIPLLQNLLVPVMPVMMKYKIGL